MSDTLHRPLKRTLNRHTSSDTLNRPASTEVQGLVFHASPRDEIDPQILRKIHFSQSLTQSTQSLISGSNLITKVYFPRIIIPLAPVVAGLLDFLIASVMLAILMLWFGIAPTWNIIFIPLLMLLMILTASGIGMWLSAMAIQYRDIKYAVQFLAQILMYAAPVVWPASLIPAKFRLIYGLYPMAGVLEGFRSALLGSRPMPWDLIGMGTVTALILFFSGAMYFRKTERIFADVA